MKGTILLATREMLWSPPMVMAATKRVTMPSDTSRGTPKAMCMLSTMAFTWGKVPIPKKATKMQAPAKKAAMGAHFSPMPWRI